jgi:DNA-directed RNA polymerase subunit RPC12/RpoP
VKILDYRDAEFPTAAVCSLCESIFPVKWSIATSDVRCPTCNTEEVMVNMTPRMVQLKRLWEMHNAKANVEDLTIDVEAFLKP